MTNKIYTTVSVKRDAKKSEAEVKASVASETLAPYIEKTLNTFVARVELKGFRKGKAPKDMVRAHIGEGTLLEEAARDCIAEAYVQILKNEKIDAIGRPAVEITKLALGNPLEFTIRTALMPELVYPNYTKLAKKHMGEKMPDTTPSADELKDTLTHIRRERARIDAFEKAKAENRDVQNALEDAAKIDEKDLPELDDAFVQTLGDFKTVADFEAKVKANMQTEKEYREKDKRRVALLDAVTEGTTGSLPEVMIHGEEARLVGELEHQLKQQNGKDVTIEDYLKHIGKTQEKMHAEWHKEAERRVRLQLALNHIAETEKLTPVDDKVAEEVEKVMKEHPKADKENVKAFVTETLQNRAVLEWLETQA